MLFIAVCDDDIGFARHLGEYLKKGFNQKCIPCRIKIYGNSKDFLHDLEGQFFDLICLDIEIDETSGTTIGRIIREKHNNNQSQIAFISSYTDYHQAGVLYDAAPMAFIRKPLKANDIDMLITKTISRVLPKQQSEDRFTFMYRKTKYSLLKADIIYIECCGRQKTVHAIDDDYFFNSNMKEVIANINDPAFILVHRSYLVNTRFIQSISGQKVVCKNGDEISVSAAYYKSALIAVTDLLEHSESG